MPNLKLPDRWEKYTNIGKVIEGTKILTFKVPLNERLCSRYPKDLWFTPSTLMEGLEADGTPLGLIIDLTFTTRYYNPMVFTDKGINYKKIFVPGKEVPSRKIIKKFCKVVDEFASDPQNAERLVGVHCTHGVNRTGHLVCRYMIDKLNIDPEVAINAYAAARGYPIERENYLEDLRNTTREEDGESEDDDEEDAEDTTNQYQHAPDVNRSHASGSGWSEYDTNRHEGRHRDRNMEYDRDRSWRSSRHYNNYSDDNDRHDDYREHESRHHWNRDYRHSQGYRHDNSYHHGNSYHGNNYRQQNYHNRDYDSQRSDPPYNRQNSWHKRNSYGDRRGNWSLNNDSDYGQFGRSHHSNRSQEKDDKR